MTRNFKIHPFAFQRLSATRSIFFLSLEGGIRFPEILFLLTVRQLSAYERFRVSTNERHVNNDSFRPTFRTDNTRASRTRYTSIVIPWTSFEEDRVSRVEYLRAKISRDREREKRKWKGKIKIRSSIFLNRDNGRLLTRNKRNRRVKSNRISRTSTIHLRLNDIGRDRSAEENASIP